MSLLTIEMILLFSRCILRFVVSVLGFSWLLMLFCFADLFSCCFKNLFSWVFVCVCARAVCSIYLWLLSGLPNLFHSSGCRGACNLDEEVSSLQKWPLRFVIPAWSFKPSFVSGYFWASPLWIPRLFGCQPLIRIEQVNTLLNEINTLK